MSKPELITDQATLSDICSAFRAAGIFAFDTEFIRDETYDAELCLVQAALGDEVLLVDPVAPDIDATVFWEVVIDPGVLKVVHAGKEDFDVCFRATGQAPRNIFDVQIAAGFVGYGYPLSLSRLVEALFNRKLSKGQTLTDWLRRPLTEEQIRYAREDVAHLLPIHARLAGELEAAGRTGSAAEEFRKFESPETYRPPIQDRLAKLKGARSLDGVGLLVLERLLAWREAWAKDRNRPVRALIRDDMLVEIARRRPRQARELEVLRGFPQARNMKIIQQILDIIEECRKTPRSALPEPAEFRDETPMMRAMVDVLSAVMRAICFEERLSQELVGGTQRLRELIDYDLGLLDTPPLLLNGWRGAFIGQRLRDVLRGKSELHVSGWPADPRIDVISHER